ncbi:hypothetical protein IAD21_05444 [Abditibacteriota bacterium]|nr:hypothetical protein IAD21_05444 [Abditibacteriota bacterium]
MPGYSMDLRERIVAALGEGASVVSVAERFGVCDRTVRRYRKRAQAGSLAPLPIPGRAPRLRAEQEEAFVSMVEEKSDWTIEQLSQEWDRRTGVFLPSSTLHDHLKRLGGRYKKRVASPVSATKMPAPNSESR